MVFTFVHKLKATFPATVEPKSILSLIIKTLVKMTVYWIHRTRAIIALPELCQDSGDRFHLYHDGPELELLQPGWIPPQYASKFI